MTEAEGKRGRRFRKIIETYDKKKNRKKENVENIFGKLRSNNT